MEKGNELRFSSSTVKITPPQGTSLAGYFTDRKAEGVHDDLYARALLLEKGPDRLLLIAFDLVGVPREFSLPLRETIADRTGIPLPAIMLCATHTHTGPVTKGRRADPGYLERLRNLVAAQAETLAAGTFPGRLDFAAGPLPGFAFNRRFFTRSGPVLTNPGANNPEVTSPAGPVDDTVNVFRLSDGQGRVKAVAVITGLHPDTVSGSMVSADWPGWLSRHVKEKLGPEVDVLVVNGPQGDINHFDVAGGRLEQGIGEAQRIGLAYGEKAVALCGQARPVRVDRLAAAAETAAIPRRRPTDAELARAREVVERYGEEYDIEKSGRTLESQDIARGDKTVEVFFARKQVELEEKFAGTSAELEIAALRIGEAALVGLGGEPFTELGLAIRNESPFRPTIVVGLANGYDGYLPMAKSFREGGYECLTTQMGDQAEGIIRSTARKLLKSIA